MENAPEKTPTKIMKETLLQTTEQGKILFQVVERMEQQEKRVDQKVTEVKELVAAVDKKVHLDDGEAMEIQAIVSKKAWEFAKEYFEGQAPSQNMYMSKVGQFRGNLYRRLKKEFNVHKYTSIKHTDFDIAYDFIDRIELADFMQREVRTTPKQYEIMANEQKVKEQFDD